MTDDELVARAREGDAAAFGELVLRHQAAVFRAALAATGSASDADDVAQEAFLLAYQAARKLPGGVEFQDMAPDDHVEPGDQPPAGEHTLVAANRDLDRGCRLRGNAGVEFASPAAYTPEQLAGAEELRCAIGRAIAVLPHKLRDALLLAQSGDYSYEEIGAMLGAPAGTIKWRVSEARRQVKAALQKQGHGDPGRPG